VAGAALAGSGASAYRVSLLRDVHDTKAAAAAGAAKKDDATTTAASWSLKSSTCALKERRNYLQNVYADKAHAAQNEADAAALRKMEKIMANQTYDVIGPEVTKAAALEKKAVEATHALTSVNKANATAKANATDAAKPIVQVPKGAVKFTLSTEMSESMKLVDDVKAITEVNQKDIQSMERDALEFHELAAAAAFDYSVPAVDKAGLQKLLEAGDKVIVVFYAPWCPHCQTYVLHDLKDKDPAKAPLEQFKKQLDKSDKKLKLVRFDVDANQAVPSQFEVQFIPTIYVADSKGAEKYESDPHDFDALTKFAVKKLGA